MNNLSYRGSKSTEFQLVVWVWLISTYMLVFGVIKEGIWENITMTGVFGYILARGITKGAEAMRDRNAPQP